MKTKLTLAMIASLITTALYAFDPPPVGTTAPDFSLTDAKGETHSPSQYKGKYVVLEWFNPECPFVKKHYGSGNMQKLFTKVRSTAKPPPIPRTFPIRPITSKSRSTNRSRANQSRRRRPNRTVARSNTNESVEELRHAEKSYRLISFLRNREAHRKI